MSLERYNERGHIINVLWGDPEQPHLPRGFEVELPCGMTVPVQDFTQRQREAIAVSPESYVARLIALHADEPFVQGMDSRKVQFDYFPRYF